MKTETTSNATHATYTISTVSGNEFSLHAPSSLLQSYEWGLFKQQFGWHPYFFLVSQRYNDIDSHNGDSSERGTHYDATTDTINTIHQNHIANVASPTTNSTANEQPPITPLLILARKIGRVFHIGYCAYAPFTALCGTSHQAYVHTVHTISQQISNLINPTLCIVRWDTLAPYGATDDILSAARKGNIPFKKSPHDIQPASTTIIDITKDPTELLQSMKAKTRYNIRLSEKKGVVVHIAVPNHSKLSKWYALYRQTAQRDKIAIHSFGYYKALSKALNAKPNEVKLELLYAEYNREMIGGILVCYFGRQATYLYGASSNNHRNAMGNYLLQWHAIQRAQQMGCTSYDLFGIPPQHNQSHAMGGLYRFKVGFNGEIVERAGCIDWIQKPFIASACRTAEKTYFWFHALKKRFA